MPQPSNLNNSSQGIIKLVPIYVGPSIIKVQVVATEAISNLASLQFGVDTKRTVGDAVAKIGDLIQVVSGTDLTQQLFFSNVAFNKTTGVLGQSGFVADGILYGSATVSLIDSIAKSALPNDVLATLTFSRSAVATPANERLELALFDVIQITGTVDDPTDSGTGVTGLSDGGGAFFVVPNSLTSQVIPENWLSVRVVDGNTLLANGDVASNSKLINSNVVMIDVDQMNGNSLVGSGVKDYPEVLGRTRISVLEDDIDGSFITTKIRFEMPNNGNSDQGILVDFDTDGVGTADTGNVDRVLTFTLDDALAALKISTGNLNLTRQQVATPYQIVAADFNGDGFVTAADALGILKTHLGHASTLQPGFTLIDIDAAELTTANAAQSTAIGYGSDPFETEISLNPTELNDYSQIADGLINSHLDVALVLRGNVVNPVSWANISNPTTEVQSFSPTPATTITLSGNGTQVSTSVQNFSAVDKQIIVSGWGSGQTDSEAPQFVLKSVSAVWFPSPSIYDQDATFTSIFPAGSSLNTSFDTIIRLQYADFGTVLALYDASVLTNAVGRPADGIADAYIELPGYFGNIFADITTTGLVISSASPYGGVAVANLPSWVPPPGS